MIIACAVLSALMPELAAPIGPYVPILLGFIMFTMGMTLTLPDLKVLRTAPHAVFIGLILQYTVMPLSGWALGVLFGLDPMLIVGMVLLGSVPGGTASNIVTYLARGNVALSVAMTSLSTLVSPLLSPLLIMWLAGSYLPVDAGRSCSRSCRSSSSPWCSGSWSSSSPGTSSPGWPGSSPGCPSQGWPSCCPA